MKTTLFLLISTAAIFLSACNSYQQPVPPHQSGDGGRGLNPGARAESGAGAGVQRNQ